MNRIYALCGVSKQGFHKHLEREIRCKEEQLQLLVIINQLRKDHPRLSSREMYLIIKPKTMGRDKFEHYCFHYGLKVPRHRSYIKTTDSRGVNRFPNLLLEIEQITAVNQVFVSDITYFRLIEEMWYLTFIEDLYSRYIVGYAASTSLCTNETTVVALNMAKKVRKRNLFDGTILHSDAGGQFYSKEFLSLTSKLKIRNSMCENVYGNAHVERVNGILKNDYLIPYNPTNPKELFTMLEKAVYLYNNQRPHKSLGRHTPAAFEESTRSGKIQKTWKIYKNTSKKTLKQVNISIGD